MKAENINPVPLIIPGGTPSAPSPTPGGAPVSLAWTGRDWLITGLLVLGFAPLLIQFFTNLWERPYYQFFPMALAGAVVLAKRGIEELPRPLAPGRTFLTLILVGGSFGLLFMGLVMWSPWLAGIAALLCLAGLAWGTGGAPALRAVFPAILLLCTFIPPPVDMDARLMVALRGVAVQWSSRMLDFLGVVHSLSGNVIDLPKRRLLVEEACSGINSVLLTFATCLFYMFWRRRPCWHLLVCLPIVFAGVLLGNVIRICFGAWLQFYYHHDILSGWRHETVGLVLLTAYLTLIVSLDEGLQFLTAPVHPVSSPLILPVVPPPQLALGLVAWRASLPATAQVWLLKVAAGFALLGAVTVGVKLSLHDRHFLLAGYYSLPVGTTFNLPPKIGEWQRLDAAAPFHTAQTQGINSQVWNYQKGPLVASLAIDYPFRGYHLVTECYRLSGWNIDHTRLETPADTGIPDVAVELSREPISYASLWFSTMDESGTWMERPPAPKGFLDGWLKRSQLNIQVQPNSYRVQLLVSGYAPLLPVEREAARQLFVAARQQLVQQLMEKLRRKS